MNSYRFRCGWREIVVVASSLAEAEYNLKQFVSSAIVEHVGREAIGGNIRYIPEREALEIAN